MTVFSRINNSPFLRNFSALTIGQLLSRAINMITCVILARWLAPEGYGEYSLIVTYIALFGVVAALGMNYIINRFVARNQDNSNKYFRICLILRLLGFIIAVIALIVYNCFRQEPFEHSVILALLAGVFFESIWSALQSVSFGMQRMEWNSIVEVITAALTALVYILIQFVSPSLLSVQSVIIIYLIILVGKDSLYYVILQKQHLLTVNSDCSVVSYNDVKDVLSQGLPFYILALVGIFTNQFPIVFLEEHAGIEEVAYFNTANKLLLPLTILMSTALTALFPNQSKLFITDKTKYWEQIKKMVWFIILAGGVMAFIITLFKNEIVILLFGEAYACTGDVMAFQCWYIVMFALFSLNGNALGASDNQKLLSIESIVFALITTPIIYYTSFRGAVGLSVGYCIASFFNVIFLYGVLIRVSNRRLSQAFIAKATFVLSCLIVISVSIPSSWNIIIRLSLLCVMGVSVAILFKTKRISKK